MTPRGWHIPGQEPGTPPKASLPAINLVRLAGLAEKAAQIEAAYRDAHSDRRKAELDLLRAVLDLLRPALPAITGRLPGVGNGRGIDVFPNSLAVDDTCHLYEWLNGRWETVGPEAIASGEVVPLIEALGDLFLGVIKGKTQERTEGERRLGSRLRAATELLRP